MAEYDILAECQVIIDANNEEEAKNIAIKNIQNCLNPYYIEAYAEGQSVKRGQWIKGDMSFIYCSECHKEAYWDTDYGQQLFDYCPYCGADMRNK